MNAKCHNCGKEIANTPPSDDYDLYCPTCGERLIAGALDEIYHKKDVA